MSDISEKHEDHYSLRNPRSLASKRKMTTIYGIDTIAFNIKRYGNLTCHCKICRTFMPCVGYID